jgi:hypothetical protein
MIRRLYLLAAFLLRSDIPEFVVIAFVFARNVTEMATLGHLQRFRDEFASCK